uniref:Protein kinase domain-containing protein n=1 Tax=Astyanax mexicanus TaxID=7994 RepID=A0A8B9GQ38_ASTMX
MSNHLPLNAIRDTVLSQSALPPASHLNPYITRVESAKIRGFSAPSLSLTLFLGSLQTLRSLTPGPDALSLWEIPAHCHLEEVEFLENGHYGPICRGQLKREGVTTSVVVKTLKGNSNSLEVNVFVELALFHAAVCKHERVVRMLHCQTRRLPMYLLFEEIAPGNLLHFLWSFREGVSGFCDQLQAFSERSVYLVAKQVASGLVSPCLHSPSVCSHFLLGYLRLRVLQWSKSLPL